MAKSTLFRDVGEETYDAIGFFDAQIEVDKNKYEIRLHCGSEQLVEI